jgi:molecular chaperone DnaK (HSP70)
MDDSPAVREQLIKLCIRQIKKEFDELVERTEEISRLADELKESYDRNDSLSKDDQEKLEKIEDLVKKVRKDLKASDDDEDEDDPASVADALNMLQGQATGLLVEIRKSTRHSISLATIKTSNALLRLAKFLQLRK